MSGPTLLVVVSLLAAAALAAWPLRSSRARRRMVMSALRRPAASVAAEEPCDPLVDWVAELRRFVDRPAAALSPMAGQPDPGGQPDRHTGSLAGRGDVPVGASTGPARSAPPPARSALSPTPQVAPGPAGPSHADGYTGLSRGAWSPGPSRPPGRRDGRRPAGGTGPLGTATSGDLRRAAGGTGPLSTATSGDLRRAAGGTGPLGTATSGDLRRDGRRPTGDTGSLATATSGGARRDAGSRPGRQAAFPLLTVSPRRTLLLVGLAGAAAGGFLSGPVAAVAVAGYGTLGARALIRRSAVQRAERARRRQLDQLCGLAADLRAGLPVSAAMESFGPGQQLGAPPVVAGADGTPDRIAPLVSAAVRLADRTGAPLAELVERIEADARSTDRGLAAAAAQAAGARATAWLLAALPLGGIGLGYGIGVDPVAVLLHTTVGGVCAVTAIGLQTAGLLWAERLGAAPGRVD